MRIPVFALTVVAALAAAGPAPAEMATLSVTGQGSAGAAPDIARLRAGVETDGATAAEALAANSALAARIIETLKAAGVAPRDLQTSGLNVQPVYDNRPRTQPQGMPPVVGYRVGNTVAVTIRDLTGLGPAIDAVVRAGANRIDSVSFGLEDDRAAADEARRAAVADARNSAEVLSQAAGVKLVRVVSMSDGGNFPPQPMAGISFRAEAMAVPVEAGETVVMANVTMVWEIAPVE